MNVERYLKDPAAKGYCDFRDFVESKSEDRHSLNSPCKR